MKILQIFLVFSFTFNVNAQSIFKQNGKYGLKDYKDSIVLQSEYDGIRWMFDELDEAPYFELIKTGKHSLVSYGKDTSRTFNWYAEKCIYDTIVKGVGHEDWKSYVTNDQHYSVDLIKDGKTPDRIARISSKGKNTLTHPNCYPNLCNPLFMDFSPVLVGQKKLHREMRFFLCGNVSNN